MRLSSISHYVLFEQPSFRSFQPALLAPVEQLTALAILKDAIDSIENRFAKKGMLLAWSATLTKLNKTFLSAEGRAESRGGFKHRLVIAAWEQSAIESLNIAKDSFTDLMQSHGWYYDKSNHYWAKDQPGIKHLFAHE